MKGDHLLLASYGWLVVAALAFIGGKEVNPILAIHAVFMVGGSIVKAIEGKRS